jgi:hypothetical protein
MWRTVMPAHTRVQRKEEHCGTGRGNSEVPRHLAPGHVHPSFWKVYSPLFCCM